jgi:hypothetical protein
MSASQDDNDIRDIMKSIDKLRQADIAEDTRDHTLKKLIKDTFTNLKGIGTRSTIRAWLYRLFGGETKEKKAAESALISLAKVYYSVSTFVRAPELLPIFKSVSCTPFQCEPAKTGSCQNKAQENHPTNVCEALGIQVRSTGWSRMFDKNGSKLNELLDEKRKTCNFHAELQTLFYYDNILTPEEQDRTHPYMGCSRRNCALCYLFLCSHGKFSSRGMHGSILHRWDIPESTLANSTSCAGDRRLLQPVLERFMGILLFLLRQLLGSSYPVDPRDLRAQSSKALSSAQLLVEEQARAMESSPRDIP